MTILLAAAMAACPAVTLPRGHAVPLATVTALSSKTSVKGQMIDLTTTADVSIDGTVVIPAGTGAVGQISDARATGGLGMSGRLSLRPLYLRIGKSLVRLTGAREDKASVSAGGVFGLAIAPAISGRSATIKAGTSLAATVEKDAAVILPCPVSG